MSDYQDKGETTMGNQLDGMEAFDTKDQKIIRECAMSGEPVIVFRAKDLLSVFVLNYYAELTEKMLPISAQIAVDVVDKLNVFKAWQQANSDKVKMPD